MEIDHPQYGWIPFTADPNDTEQLGRDLYAAAIDGTLGVVEPYIAPIPTTAQLILAGETAAQNLLDSTAKAWGYDSLLSAASYVNSLVPQYKSESAVLTQWRDSLWSTAFQIEQACTATPPTQAFPTTIDAFLAMLPAVPVRP